MNDKKVAVLGAGPAGLAAAITLAEMGLAVSLYEKSSEAGKKIRSNHNLFPDRISAKEVHKKLLKWLDHPMIRWIPDTQVIRLSRVSRSLKLETEKGTHDEFDAVIISTGFDFFDARLKEEFGFGIYERVIDSPGLETLFNSSKLPLTFNGKDPQTVAFVHCVGSRDSQSGINYCSRLCCITGIKQAIQVKELYPQCRVYNFYIDLRAGGRGYEELFREAQEKYGIQFIRGRVSEAGENDHHRIVIKAEDTLMGRPLKVTTDWLVLLIGMVPCKSNIEFEPGNENTTGQDGFYQISRYMNSNRVDNQAGVYVAGSCCGPMNIPESIASGRSAAAEVFQYLKHQS